MKPGQGGETVDVPLRFGFILNVVSYAFNTPLHPTSCTLRYTPLHPISCTLRYSCLTYSTTHATPWPVMPASPSASLAPFTRWHTRQIKVPKPPELSILHAARRIREQEPVGYVYIPALLLLLPIPLLAPTTIDRI